jgi:hypothetical protein
MHYLQNFQCSRFDANQKSFGIFKAFKLLNRFFFFEDLKNQIKCVSFIFKIEQDFNIAD